MRASAAPRATPVMGEVAGRPVAMSYGDVAGEYAALRRGALLVDRSHRARLSMRGTAASETLTGLVTNDVGALVPGQGLYAAALTPKGKIVADLRIFSLAADDLLIDAPARAGAGWMDMVRKYVNPRLAAYTDESGAMGTLGVFGVQARRIAAEATGAPGLILGGLAMYAHVPAEAHGARVLIVRTPELGLEGYELFAPAALVPALWVRLAEAGATPGGLESWEIARIEAGRPEWGLDIDDTTIPQEANFDDLHAISYTKGCYVGQETVARVHFRGHVNKHLRGLRFVSPAPPPPRAQLLDDGGKMVGDVRSAALSPRLGGVAIGMVRREVPIGATLAAVWDGGECQVEVAYLPFPL